MKSMTLKDLFLNKISALYDMELELVKALPKAIEVVHDKELKKAFRYHLKETSEHQKRIEKVFGILARPPRALKGEAIRGLIQDSKWIAKNVQPANARDSSLIRAAQYIQYYEIAGYAGAIDWSRELGESRITRLLTENCHEERLTNKILSDIAKRIDLEVLKAQEE